MHWVAPSEKDTDNAALEKRLWAAADQFRANSGLKSQEYSAPVLGLIFLRFAEVRFTAQRARLEKAVPSSRRGNRVDDPTAYNAEGILYLPAEARFDYLPNVTILVTGRDTYSYSRWVDAAQLRVNPFSSERLNQFVNNWFTSEPSKVETVMAWLSANQRMREAACTPIIAALLCSLVGADADLPSTEVELYEQRFELLLGRWEKAKGGLSMSASLRRRYWHFITTVAYAIHLETHRTIDYPQLLKLAEAFHDKNYHVTAANFITDCVHRGILFQEPENQLSFGHLTYQEFLVAKYLAEDNPIDLILHRVGHPWWSKVLDFYAALKGDIRSLVMKAIVHPQSDDYLKKLLDMCTKATLTPKEAQDRLMMAYTKLYEQIPAIVDRR